MNNAPCSVYHKKLVSIKNNTPGYRCHKCPTKMDVGQECYICNNCSTILCEGRCYPREQQIKEEFLLEQERKCKIRKHKVNKTTPNTQEDQVCTGFCREVIQLDTLVHMCKCGYRKECDYCYTYRRPNNQSHLRSFVNQSSSNRVFEENVENGNPDNSELRAEGEPNTGEPNTHIQTTQNMCDDSHQDQQSNDQSQPQQEQSQSWTMVDPPQQEQSQSWIMVDSPQQENDQSQTMIDSPQQDPDQLQQEPDSLQQEPEQSQQELESDQQQVESAQQESWTVVESPPYQPQWQYTPPQFQHIHVAGTTEILTADESTCKGQNCGSRIYRGQSFFRCNCQTQLCPGCHIYNIQQQNRFWNQK